ncbi:SigE family RNA polymerase sigma factor [Catenuloplanes atrovinosus]|uniref:RNA polymerase sigma-70 factor (Sigma-E family) n=1 Tax=Catenuloplanes atrovinosus TaxID=137266 RepID=A0AAE4CE08_9ACTN|nr:SigE family RNA polymerase sigma factor [Catenuloplanes atrovinosus]MDR7278100.1 RNA polymerase sigma-70 factor (sigma-E family) [Catenuloplanes atrovinosus]
MTIRTVIVARRDEDFTEFARASWDRLARAAYLMTGDRHQAEDAAQTALARTFAAWSRVRRQDAYAYARRTLVNHLTDGWRRPIKEQPYDMVPDQPAHTDVADQVARRQWLLGALRGLAPRERAVVVLRYYFDLPEAEVATELGISVGAVKSMAARGLARLRVRTDLPDRIKPGATR